MGLPKININFIEKGINAIQRSGRGVVALILADSADSTDYAQLMDVNEEDFTAENYQYIKQVFLGKPSKVIVEVVEAEADLASALTNLRNKRFNYLAYPDVEETDTAILVDFIESENDKDQAFKLVVADEAADNEAIINFTTNGIEVGEETFTASEYTPRIAGILAGIELSRSATYFVLPEVDAIEPIEDADGAIDNGELILIDDGEKIKIGRAVNSLTTTGEEKGDSYKKIKIVEGIHLVDQDIRRTFADDFVGKYVNDYDNKVLFTTAVNAYFREMERAYVLDSSADNKVEVDVEAQTLYIQGKGISTDELSTQQIKEYNTGSNVFLSGTVKFVDAMEDLDFNIHI